MTSWIRRAGQLHVGLEPFLGMVAEVLKGGWTKGTEEERVGKIHFVGVS